MEYGVLYLPPLPRNTCKKVTAWNKGLTWEQMGFSETLRKKIIKQNLSKGNAASWRVRRGKPAVNSVPVVCIHPENGRVIGRFESARFAMKATGVQERNIRKVCNGERKKAGPFMWKFEKDL